MTGVSALGAVLASFAVVLTTAPPAAADGVFQDTSQCVAGTFVVRHGVTAVHIHAVGAAGEDGVDVTQNQLGGTVDWQGGTGGLGSSVETTIPVTTGMTLYVGVANSGMPGGARPGDNTGGKGGAASWVTDTNPVVNGVCAPSAAHAVVVAAGGGGGGAAGNRIQAHPGGAGGTEAAGGSGGDGAEGIFDDDGGHGGSYSNGSSGGGGGIGGSAAGCTSGEAGAAGTALAGGHGGEAGVPTFGSSDCSDPPPTCSRCPSLGNGVYGGGGGGGGGGLWGGGGGGGGDSSGYGAGGGGASGRSYARNPISYAMAATRVPPIVTVEALTSAPVITSGSSATFTRGTFGSTPGSATGVETPYVRFLGTLPNGLANHSGSYADDGSGDGTATLSGTPFEDGVFALTVNACNSVGCADQPFTLTVNGSPGITSPDTNTFVVGSAGSHTVRTSGYPAATITQSGAPAWLTLTDNHDGTATLAGTPPAGAASSYVVNLTAANGIGSNATQALTIRVVTALSVTPGTVHLVPGSTDPGFAQYRRGFEQQLHAIGTFPDGSTGDVTGFVRWDSSAPGIASVTGGALVFAHALGTATVNARTAAAAPATASIVVAMPQSITVSPPTVSLLGGQTQQFTATGCYADPCASNSFDITHNVRWYTSNFSARVDDDGLATANQGGTVSTVFAELFAGVSGVPSRRGEADITVTHGNVVSVTVTPADLTVPTRTTVHYHAMLTYQDGTLVHDSPAVTWSASGITTASIGPGGDAYSPDPGTLTVTGTFTNIGGGVVPGTATLHVIRLPSSLVVTPLSGAAATPLVKGGTRQYKAVAHYSDGAPDLDVTSSVQWVSTEPADATISAGGLVTAKASTEGETVLIYARYTYDNGLGGTSNLDGTSIVTITVVPPVSIAITPTTTPVLHPGDSVQLTATGTYADGTTVNLTYLVKSADPDGSNATYHVMWSSTNTFVGVVNSTGQLHVPAGTTQGTVTVSAEILGAGGTVLHSNDVVVTVTDPLDHIRLHSLDPNGSPSTLVAGTSTVYPYAVEGLDSHNNSLGDVTDDSVISMSPDGACDQVLLTCSARVADLGLARHTITATNPNAVHPTSPGIQIQILRAATARVEITGGSSAIIAGTSTAPYHVTGWDAFDNAFDATNQTSFRLLDTAATSGCDPGPAGSAPTCHAAVAGAHTVRASAFSGTFTQDLPLWVYPAPVLDHITLSGGVTQVPVGGTSGPYHVTGFDAYGNSGDVTTQTVLEITPDGTCDNTAFTCTPGAAGPHSVTAYRNVGAELTSNTLSLAAVGPPALGVAIAHSPYVKGSGIPLPSVTFTLTNANSVPLTGVGFAAAWDPSLIVQGLSNNCTDDTITLPSGGFTFAGGTLPANGSCTYTLQLLPFAAGSFDVTTSGLTSANGGSSAASATGTIVVTGPPVLTKSFVAGSVPVGSTTPLTFTVTNPNSALTLTGIGFFDPLPAGLSFASTTITGTCGGAAMSISGSTLFVGPDGANGAIGSGAHGATLAPGASCTFSADVHADTLGSKSNTTSNVTSTERGTGPQAHATVVVTPPVDHFDILMTTLTAGTPGPVTITARDRSGNVMTDYAGTPTITGDFTDSATGCGPNQTDPCHVTYDLPAFVNGQGTATITAYVLSSDRSVTVTDVSASTQSSPGIHVNPGAFDHMTLEGGSASISAGDFTGSYFARAWDRYGNLRQNSVPFAISISPDGDCNGVDICGAHIADSGGTHHTVTATNANALHPTATRSLVVGHGPIAQIVLDGGNRTLVAGQTTQPYTVYGFDVFDNRVDDLPVSDVTFTADPDGTCNNTTRTCTLTKADPPGWYHLIRAEYVTGPFAFADQLVVSPGPLDHLVLAPATTSVAPGQYQAYVAAGYDHYGNALGDKTDLTTFTVDGGGSCTGASCQATTAGDHTVTGTLGTATGTATMTVHVGRLFHIALTGGSGSIVTGTSTAPYAVQGYDADGNLIGDVTAGSTLSVAPDGSCDNVAHTCTATTVDNGGFHVVTATNPSAAGGPTTTANLTVTSVPVDHIALTGGSASITAGTATSPYVVTAYDASNASLGVVTSNATLSISPDGSCSQAAHTCTASVADTGAGHHTVTATLAGAVHPTATSNVVVTALGGGGGGGTPGVLDHFGIGVHNLAAGVFGFFNVVAYDSTGQVVTGYTGSPTLTGTIGSSPVACGPVGLDPCPARYFLSPFTNGVAKASIQAFAAGTGRTVTVTDGSIGTTSGTFDVTPGDLDHTALSGGSASVAAGANTDPYVVTGYDIFGNALGDYTDESTFSLDDATGSCTGAVCSETLAGPHAVQAHTDAAPAPDVWADLTVTAGPVAQIFLNGDGSAEAGRATSPFQVDGYDAYFNYVGDVTAGTTLSLEPDGSCEQVTHTCQSTVADALLDAHTVVGKYPGARDARELLFIAPAAFDHLVVSPDNATIAAGGTQAYTAEGFDRFGNSRGDVTDDTTFGISDGSCTGAVCGSTVAANHTVTGTLDKKHDDTMLNVVPAALDHITLTGGSTTVTAGTATAPYHVEGWDAYDNDRGDVTADSPLSITPDGTCSPSAHTCTPASGGAHTVTATDSAAVHPTATKSLAVTGSTGADVRLTKTGPSTATPGTNVTYTLSARNFGPGTATGVVVSDPYPAGTSYVSDLHPSGWTCTTATAFTCTRASLTTGDNAQPFTLVLRVNPTATIQVSNTATVTTTSTDPTPANNTPPAVVTTLGCTRTITGLYAGDLLLSGAGTTCLRNVTVTGKLTVQKGAALVAVSATVGGAVATSGSGALSFCGSTLRSSVNLDGAIGFVLFGDPGDDACAGNSVIGSMSVTNGKAGVDMRSNVLSSSLNVDQNKGGGPFPADVAPVVAGNRMGGRLSCKSNNPAPVNAGAVNTAPTKSGQCASL